MLTWLLTWLWWERIGGRGKSYVRCHRRQRRNRRRVAWVPSAGRVVHSVRAGRCRRSLTSRRSSCKLLLHIGCELRLWRSHWQSRRRLEGRCRTHRRHGTETRKILRLPIWLTLIRRHCDIFVWTRCLCGGQLSVHHLGRRQSRGRSELRRRLRRRTLIFIPPDFDNPTIHFPTIKRVDCILRLLGRRKDGCAPSL